MSINMVNPSERTLERIANIEKIITESERLTELMMPLVKKVLPIRHKADIDGVPVSDREITLKKEEWKK